MGEGIELHCIALAKISCVGPVVGRYPTQNNSRRPNETDATDRYLPYIIDMMTGYCFAMGVSALQSTQLVERPT